MAPGITPTEHHFHQPSFDSLTNGYRTFNKFPIVEPAKATISIPTHVEPLLTQSSFDVPIAEYPKISTSRFPESPAVIRDIVSKKLADLNTVLEAREFEKLGVILGSTSYWRDHLGISATKYSTSVGPDEIIGYMRTFASENRIGNFETESGKEPKAASVDPYGNIKCLQSYITFETANGKGRGMVTLLQDVENDDEWRIYNIFTTLWELKEFPPLNGDTRRFQSKPEDVPDLMNWKEYRDEKKEFKNEEPAVLIVGAGHSGLMTAARLSMLGVSTLIIDKQGRSGDSWRTRYHDLVLHDPCWMNAMPYLPYPPSWPILASKDQIADFFEYYESALELNLWNTSQVTKSTWDDRKMEWTVNIDRIQNGKLVRRTIHPRHIVQATGLNGEPNTPNIPGMADFKGKILHTSQFLSASPEYSGKKVIVIGTGTSGHDVAHSCARHGADVTIVQRSATFVTTVATTHIGLRARWNEHVNADDGDISAIATPTTLLKKVGSDASVISMTKDRTILDGLRAVGFHLIETEPPALLPLTIQRAGGFYIDVGASTLIAQRKIKYKWSPKGISHITFNSIIFADGSELEADEIVFATGYGNGRTRTRKVFGDEVADRIDPIWGFDKHGEIKGTWRRSGQEGFWVAAGAFWISRYYSRLLALQIKAVEEGLSEL